MNAEMAARFRSSWAVALLALTPIAATGCSGGRESAAEPTAAQSLQSTATTADAPRMAPTVAPTANVPTANVPTTNVPTTNVPTTVVPTTAVQTMEPATTAVSEVGSPAASLIASANSQIGVTTGYDPSYVRLAFPGGDVDISTGVCSDVIIRSYRGIGIDLQEQVNTDMRANFSKYPATWGLSKPDPNIDHRRVPNLETFFKRKGASLPVTDRGADYQPGDVVTWRINNQLPHTGLVSSELVAGTDRFLIVHNVGQGTRKEDILFTWPITGHYRWLTS
jgi:uncharacterized protein